ncbi:hypothetical protein ACE1AT_11035 [Pelatocladus sp. BLCC-F211]|uniref:hypothetical protein n=1 Tax=Pelatocladus sp. BLCC-F211 TaxID=3342752 RepID=UPI0035B6CBDC
MNGNSPGQNSLVQSVMQSVAAIASTIAVGALTWVWQSTALNTERLARIEEQLKLVTTDRYTATDAIKDSRISDARFVGLERRIEILEKQAK